MATASTATPRSGRKICACASTRNESPPNLWPLRAHNARLECERAGHHRRVQTVRDRTAARTGRALRGFPDAGDGMGGLFAEKAGGMSRIDFVVCGRAIPQGGLRIIPLPDGKRILAPNNSAKLNPWRKKVREAAKAAMRDAAWEMFGPEIPLCAQLQFCFLRPKSTDRRFPTVKPDIDKLERAILDSLTGIVWT